MLRLTEHIQEINFKLYKEVSCLSHSGLLVPSSQNTFPLSQSRHSGYQTQTALETAYNPTQISLGLQGETHKIEATLHM